MCGITNGNSLALAPSIAASIFAFPAFPSGCLSIAVITVASI